MPNTANSLSVVSNAPVNLTPPADPEKIGPITGAKVRGRGSDGHQLARGGSGRDQRRRGGERAGGNQREEAA